MTYQEAVDYLFSQLPMFSKVGAAAYKKDLHNIRKLCDHLGNPQNKFKSIHIAGTNGKGSTSHMLSAILQNAGFKTGLYTSPHLFDFTERIRIDGKPISEAFVVDFVEKIKDIAKEISPSFFEITVAMAFQYFAEEEIDFAVVETGLGGRLDSTNIIHPILCVITSVGLDHQDLLGDTIEKIANEKAGIIKHKSSVVLSDVPTEVLHVFSRTTKATQSPVMYTNNFAYILGYYTKDNLLHCDYLMKDEKQEFCVELDLQGFYQSKNALAAVCSIFMLRKLGYKITNNQMYDALKKVVPLTGLRGRWEILRRDPLTILDVGHNIDGFTEIVTQLNMQYPRVKKHIILGFVKDKQIGPILKMLPKEAVYYFTQAQIARALPVEELQDFAQKHGLNGNAYTNINEAMEAATENAKSEDLIFVTGSFFTIGELDVKRFADPKN